MLVSLTTQLARAKRAKQPLLFAQVTTLEIAVAAVRAAEHAKRSLVLTIDSNHRLLYSLEYMATALLALGSASEADITVEVLVGTSHLALEQALYLGVQVLTPVVSDKNLTQTKAALEWLSPVARGKGVEVVLDLSSQTIEDPAALDELTKLSACNAIRVTALTGGKLRTDAIQHLHNRYKLPILAGTGEYSPTQLRRFASLHLSGPVLKAELEEAFTAGLRAGLRDREEFEPRIYLPKAQLAVEDQLIRTYSLLCTT